MNLDKKLEAWQQAELIDANTAKRIRALESGTTRPILLWAMGGIGALAVGLGFISIVAANWSSIPNAMKLGVAFGLGCVLALSIYRALDITSPMARSTHPGSREWLLETLVIIFYGYALASLALVGQVYQLGGTIGGLLWLWTLGTIGLVFIGRGRALATLFFLGLLSTLTANLDEWFDTFQQLHSETKGFEENLAVFIAGASPLLFLLVSCLFSRIPTLLRARSHFAEVFGTGSWVLLAILGNYLQFLWYVGRDDTFFPRTAVWACLAAGILVAAAIPKLYPHQNPRAQLGMRCAILAVYAMGALGAGFDHASLPLIGALLNLGFLCLLAWAALQAGLKAAFTLLTALVGLRVIIIYFEVFGSLLQTGLGLIGGGPAHLAGRLGLAT